jgi:predicted nucleotidyltransferase
VSKKADGCSARPSDAAGQFSALLREAFSGVPGIEAAFVFGSMARSDARPDSDVDMGGEIPRRAFAQSTSESSALLGREVNVVRGDFDRLSEGNAFLRNVMSGPTQWIVGDPGTLSERSPLLG